DYLRLKSLQIGYTLKNYYLYLSGNNLLTFTKFSGYDPGVDLRQGTISSVAFTSQMPQSRVFSIGLSAKFSLLQTYIMQFYKHTLRIFTLLFVSLLGSSCDKYFELARPVQFPWQNAQELELAVREGYLQLSNDPWFSPLGTLSMVHFGQSDIVRLLPEAIQGNNYATQYYNRAYRTAPADKEVGEAFQFLYYIITNNNAALKLLEEAEAA